MGSGRIATHLAENRRRLFVGRAAELAAFERLIADGGSTSVYFVHGPGGIGKTTLLHAFEERARQVGYEVAYCDVRSIPADPRIARTVMDATLGNAREARTVLILDTFEEWAAIEAWLRDEYIPKLPDGVRVVVAGRRRPGLPWRTDPGWHGVLAHGELSPLSAAECRDYLERRAIPEASLDPAVERSRGQPLLLALIADALRAGPLGEAVASVEGDVLEELLVELADHLVPAAEPDAKAALYLTSLARHTTETLLAAALRVEASRAGALYRWLQELSFVETNVNGLFPHDVMRAALRTRLEKRDAEAHVALLDAAVPFFLDGFERSGDPDPTLLLEGLYLFTSFMPTFFGDSILADEPSYAEPLRPEQLSRVREIVERCEGSDALEIFDFWWREQPEATSVVRDSEGAVTGFFTFLRLVEPPEAWLEHDPIVASFWGARHELVRPWRDGADTALLLRTWGHATKHMGPSPVALLWPVEMARVTMAPPGVAMSAAVHPDTEDWRVNARLYGHRELPGSRVRSTGQTTLATFHDFSEETGTEWLRNTYRRFHEGVHHRPPPPEIDPASLRAALRNLHRPDRLEGNALLARLGGPDPVPRLQALLRRECQGLEGNPKTETLFRVLDRTYLHPAVDQRAAAEACHLSWDQYRRRLTEAIKLLHLRLERSLG